jgi:diacylglycerol kinase family enzyme
MSSNKRPVVVLWNSASGWQDDRREAARVKQTVTESGVPLRFERMGKGSDIAARSRKLARGEPKVLVAAGGDGTINAVAHAVVNTHHALGVIPAGTLNHFARDLAIPLNVEDAAQSLVNGHEIKVDVGTVNGRLFVNNSVLGLYPVYRAARDAYERKGLGANRFTRFIAVLRSLVRVLVHMPSYRLHLMLEDGRSVHIETAFVLVANNEHEVEHWNIGHRQYLDQGHLWIYVLKQCNRWGLCGFFLRFLLKRFSRHDAFDIYKARSVRVEARVRHLKVSLDGEIARLETPLEFRSLPGALRVIAPLGYTPQLAPEREVLKEV